MVSAHRRRSIGLLVILLVLLAVPLPAFAQTGEGDPAVLAKMHQINAELANRGLRIAVEEVEFFTIGRGRLSNRIHQQEFRWVAGDERRLAQEDDITYLVDQSAGSTNSGLASAETEAAIDRAFTTWAENSCLRKVDLVKRVDSGADLTIYDWFFGYGGFGDPFAADIVNAGWFPRSFFEAVGGPDGGRGILAFSVTFIFTNDDGSATDINGDNYLDSALNEVYYNNTFGDPKDDRGDNPW